MAERTPEQINRIVDGINTVLPHMGNPDGERLVQEAIDGSVLSGELQSGIRSAIDQARWQGVLDGIQYAIGQGELPDIESQLRTSETMARYLTPAVRRSILGPRVDSQKGSGNNG